MNRFLTAFFALVLLCGCNEQDKYVRWVNRHLTYEEKSDYKPEFWEQNVAKSLEVRDKVDWKVPDKIFRHFVLPVQTIGRPVDNFRVEYADSLLQRIDGLSMWDAAREINYWCLERATYKEDNYMDDTVMGTIERGWGACDELTNFYVSALRAAGIPARAGSATWLHASTSHKWTEIWIDGEWHFDCSCEPWEDIDLNWMCFGICKAMIVPITVFGPYRGPEPVLSRNRYRTIIDNGARYAPRRMTTVTVVDGKGRRVRGATVEFKVFNSGNLNTLHSDKTDRKGRVRLETTETGTLIAWACKDGMYGFCKADKADNGLAMTHPLSEGGTAEFAICSPDRVALPHPVTDAQQEVKTIRDSLARLIREARHAKPCSDSLITLYRTEVQRPHLPSRSWTLKGKTAIKIEADEGIIYGDNLGLLRILEDGSTERVASPMVGPGTYMMSCAQRLIACSELVKSTIFTVPEGAESIKIAASLPTVPPAELKSLYKIKNPERIGLDGPCQVLSMSDDDVYSKVIMEWGIDIAKTVPSCKALTTFEPEKELSAKEVMKEVAEDLGLKIPFIIVTDPEGNVWYATEKWENDTEMELTAIRNALEKR